MSEGSTTESLTLALNEATASGRRAADAAWRSWARLVGSYGNPPTDPFLRDALPRFGLPDYPTADDYAAATMLMLFVGEMRERTDEVRARHPETDGTIEFSNSAVIAAGNGFAERLGEHRGVPGVVLAGGRLVDAEARWAARKQARHGS